MEEEMEEGMEEGILTSVKKLLGIEESYTHFDDDIIMDINSVFMILAQIGVGPEEGFTISDSSATWSDFTSMRNIEAVKSYVHHRFAYCLIRLLIRQLWNLKNRLLLN